MKISAVEALHLRLPKVAEVADGTQDCLIIRIQTDDGITGLGEVVSCSHVARAVVEAPRSAPFRHGLAAIVQDMESLDINAVQQAMISGTAWYGPGGVTRQAMSGIDMALWDIRGKIEGKPVRKLLREDALNQVDCYASVLWPDGPALVADSAKAFIAEGYRAVKYGWQPMGPDPDLDEALVAAARESLGPEIALMVDAGRAWDTETALNRVERFKPYNLSWLEEPLDPYDISGYKYLCEQSDIPIACGEAMTLVSEYEKLLRECGLHIVQPDLGRIGGITEGQKVAELANTSQTRPVPHAFGTGLLLAASANWAASLEHPLCEFTRAPSPLAQDLVDHSIEFNNGRLVLPDSPGLGVELNEDVVRRYRVA